MRTNIIMMKIRICSTLWTLFSLCPILIESLKLIGTVIPSYGVLNGAEVLQCNFQLEKDSLYALKWYKDGHEFFRFKPSDEPPITVFPLTGVTVNENGSSLHTVELAPISLLSKGVYRCEISADAPSFQTVFEDHYMSIMALPFKGPKLSRIHPWYNLGENFTAHCSVEKCFPSPQLIWLVNNAQLDAEICECITSETVEAGRAIDGTMFYSSKSYLHFPLDSHYFRDGSLQVECKAIFPKSAVVLKDTFQSNIKAGFGYQYADMRSAAHKIATQPFWSSFQRHLLVLFVTLRLILPQILNLFVMAEAQNLNVRR